MASFIQLVICLTIGKLIYKFLLEERVNHLFDSIFERIQQKKDHEAISRIAEENSRKKNA